MGLELDVQEIVQRIVKYLIIGLAVSLSAHLVLSGKSTPNKMEVLSLGLTAAATFAILDYFVPSIGASARNGAGFGIGANMVGFPM